MGLPVGTAHLADRLHRERGRLHVPTITPAHGRQGRSIWESQALPAYTFHCWRIVGAGPPYRTRHATRDQSHAWSEWRESIAERLGTAEDVDALSPADCGVEPWPTTRSGEVRRYATAAPQRGGSGATFRKLSNASVAPFRAWPSGPASSSGFQARQRRISRNCASALHGEIFVDRRSRFAALGNRPHHKRLSAPHIARCEHARYRRHVILAGRDICRAGRA